MGAIRVTVKDVLERHGKTAYWLAERAEKTPGIKLTKGALYNIVAGRANPSLDSIAQILEVLNRWLDEDIELDQVLEYDPEAEDTRPPKGTRRKSLKQLQREALASEASE